MLSDNSIQRMSDEKLLIRWQEVLDEALFFIDRGLCGQSHQNRKSDLAVAKNRMITWKAMRAEIKRRKELYAHPS